MIKSAVGYHGERIKSEVDTARGSNRLGRLCSELGNAQGVPVTRSGLLDRHAFDRAVLVSVVNPHPTELGDFDASTFQDDILGKTQFRRRPVSGLKAWILAAFLKKVLIGPLKVTQTLLQTVGVHVVQPAVSLFVNGHLGRLLNVGQALTRRFVSFFASSQAPVVDMAAKATHVRELPGLRSGRAQLDFKRAGILIHGQVSLAPALIISRLPRSKPRSLRLVPQAQRQGTPLNSSPLLK